MYTHIYTCSRKGCNWSWWRRIIGIWWIWKQVNDDSKLSVLDDCGGDKGCDVTTQDRDYRRILLGRADAAYCILNASTGDSGGSYLAYGYECIV